MARISRARPGACVRAMAFIFIKAGALKLGDYVERELKRVLARATPALRVAFSREPR
jgi:hypothetical protein